MRIIYKGKFKEDLNDYIQEQPWMFELDFGGVSFWELPIAMQWGVVFSFLAYEIVQMDPLDYSEGTVEENLKKDIIFAQKWYNKNK